MLDGFDEGERPAEGDVGPLLDAMALACGGLAPHVVGAAETKSVPQCILPSSNLHVLMRRKGVVKLTDSLREVTDVVMKVACC